MFQRSILHTSIEPVHRSNRKCIVLDESEKGARLEVNRPSEIPDNFYIYMTLESTSRRQCRVAWRSDKQMGVEYLD
jgi:hypothetical protein